MTTDSDGHLTLLEEKMTENVRRLDERFDDLRWYVTKLAVGLGALGSLIPAALIVFVALNFNHEKASLDTFKSDTKQEVKEALGKTVKPPELVIFGPNRRPLQGQTLDAKIERTREGQWRLTFSTMERNEGGSSTGRRFYKLYASDPLRLPNASSDEPEFKYESYINPDKIDPGELFAGASQNSYWSFGIVPQPPLGTYPVLVKVYYGNDRVGSVKFSVNVSKGS